MLEISVVVPVYGCRSCLHSLHERLNASLSSITSSFELIFVDDCSPDGAWEDLSAMAESFPEVKAFGLSRNFGQDAAITAGLAKANGRWTVVLDCDLQEPPEAIPHLYARAQEGYDLVRTTRSQRGHPRSRRLASRAYRRLFPGNDSGREYSNMSMLSRAVVNAFMSMRDRDREYSLVLDWLGFRSTTVEIEFSERADGRSAYTLRRLLNVAFAGMFFRTTVLLRVVIFLGFLIAALGGGLAAYNVYEYLAGNQPTGYTSLAVLLLLLAGFIIISVGVVGLYVGRIFEQVKSRPLFIVSRTAGVPDAASQEILSEKVTDDISVTSEPEAPSTASLE
jgi:polyisoprenyl-phosphate glycosyltransferase